MARRYPPNPFEPFGPGGPGVPSMSDIRIPRPPRRFWIGLGFIAAAIAIILVAAPLVGAITEFQWFDALGFGGVYKTVIGLQALLFFLSFFIALAFALVNLVVALRSRAGAPLRQLGIRRPVLRSGLGALGLAVSALLALVLGLTMRGDWNNLVLFRQATPTGVKDPVFNNDVSFYLLQIPFLQDVQGWLLALVVVTGLLVVGLYAWRGDHFDFRLQPRAIGHLSALLGAMALVIAFGTWIDRYSYLWGKTGVVSGAGFADINAGIPLTTARVVVAVLLAVVLVVNLRLRWLRVALGAIGVWILAAILAGIYPALVQRIGVQPAELAQERPYIQREIQFTRSAYALSHVQSSQFGGDKQVSAADVAADQTTIQNLRLWDAGPVQDTYQQLQAIRTYYSFANIDLDRYVIDGTYQQVEISAREMDQSKLQAQGQGWVNQRLVYTHGYGVVASPVSKVVGEGLPQFVAQDIPTTGPLKVTDPQIYFGNKESDYVLAPSRQAEFDYPNGANNTHTQWGGTQAPQMSGLNRLLWSMKTGDFNLLVSSEVTDQTRILYRRNVQDRVNALAPFLSTPDQPYPVVVNGHLYWIQDALVTASTYPYSQAQDDGTNYVRNSVKAVVDAYTGQVTFYIADQQDPIIRAYAAAFPGMFKPLGQMPPGLVAHLRVPPSFFNVQASTYETYHISDPNVLYNREDIWSAPAGINPFYVLMRLPGQSKAEYLMILPYTPLNKNNLVGWLAVRQDAPHYGQMVSFVLPKDKTVFGPSQVLNRIDQTTDISKDYTLLNQSGSNVIKGNLLVVPIGDSFLYFEPWYLKSTSSQTSLPELKKVILVDGTQQGTVAYQNTLEDAINQLVGEQIVQPPTGGKPPTSALSAQIAQLAQQANQHYNNANAALANHDFATYGTEINQVGALLNQINQLLGSQSGPTPSPSPSPSGG